MLIFLIIAMDYRQRIKYQRIAALTIPSAGAQATANAVRTDELYEYITGIAVTITGDENGFNNSTFQLFQIDNYEIFPPGYDVKLLKITNNSLVSPNNRFYQFVDAEGNMIFYPAKNSRMDISYLDGSFAGVVYPYTVNIWLRLENIDKEKEDTIVMLSNRITDVISNKLDEIAKKFDVILEDSKKLMKQGDGYKNPQSK
jgi:hypothetical protein